MWVRYITLISEDITPECLCEKAGFTAVNIKLEVTR